RILVETMAWLLVATGLALFVISLVFTADVASDVRFPALPGHPPRAPNPLAATGVGFMLLGVLMAVRDRFSRWAAFLELLVLPLLWASFITVLAHLYGIRSLNDPVFQHLLLSSGAALGLSVLA